VNQSQDGTCPVHAGDDQRTYVTTASTQYTTETQDNQRYGDITLTMGTNYPRALFHVHNIDIYEELCFSGAATIAM
jgi:hypothetical protein